MKDQELIPHLFRTEYSRIVAVLCKGFGLANIQLAEDITSDTFLKATETWGLKGVPSHPKAWIYKVAKNKLKDHFKRKQTFTSKVQPRIAIHRNIIDNFELDFTEHNILDSQLQMMFCVCDPIIAIESQIAMALRVLCGFGIDEISSALLTNKATINKRLQRAKLSFRKNNISLSFPTPRTFKRKIGQCTNGFIFVI